MNLHDWIEAQHPPVPEDFRSWILRHLQESPVGGNALAREARDALGRALDGTGARNGAFDLLVADALATWAAQALLDGDDAERRLDDLVSTLAG